MEEAEPLLSVPVLAGEVMDILLPGEGALLAGPVPGEGALNMPDEVERRLILMLLLAGPESSSDRQGGGVGRMEVRLTPCTIEARRSEVSSMEARPAVERRLFCIILELCWRSYCCEKVCVFVGLLLVGSLYGSTHLHHKTSSTLGFL